MRKRVLNAALVVAAAVLAAACDGKGSATGPTGSQMSAADAASLNRAVYSTGASFSGGSVPSGARGARLTSTAGSTFSFNFNTTVPCSPSGSTALSGNLAGGYDLTAKQADVQANIAVAHQACAIKTDNGAVFTLTGDPNIDVTLNAASGASGLTAFHVSEVGAFNWTKGDGNSGHCTVNVTGDLVAGTQTVKLSGDFCGFPLDQTVPAAG